MPGLCFHFEPNDIDVWSGREIDLDAWNYAVKAAGDIDEIVVINRTSASLRPLDADIPFLQVSELPSLGRAAFLCAPDEAAAVSVSLWDFSHDVDWYVFGPAAGWDHVPELGVHIPTALGIPFHAVHAATVALAHRFHVIGA